ncbi:MAG: Arc family DNA-binding protein [Cyanobacteria bacterium SZAS LIN-2]|nr:Arc family DNA-binding protein [Cyanobacteria bacterium SZAS LIN-3]MBS1999082.1 Arc family DNA-binding protein [Cyanobacteria bacterium SZAS LIN-2]MBS2010413.1 Arc family DNA-binding protein [Cyanobacteria bacterium SZAS TMP-1]
MPSITVKNIPDETYSALRARAAKHGRSTEAEIRAILEESVRSEERLKIGSELAAFGDKFQLELEIVRDPEPLRIASFAPINPWV